MVNKEQVLKALSGVQDPELRKNLVELGMIHDVKIQEGQVQFTFALTTMACPFKEEMAEQARAAVAALEGVDAVQVEMRAMTPKERERIIPKDKDGVAASLNHIKHVVAVMSGKGGVGKSLVAGLLAVALRRQGYEVGILDADITGPSIPRMFFSDPPQPRGGPMGLIPPDSSTGIRVMSINLLLPREDEAVIWRGPLISRAIQQFWGDVIWGDLDVLVVDLPPGTSDAALTVMQSLPLDGVVLVTSPQGLAGMVVRKAARMAQQMGVSLLGLVENMSYVVCPDCEGEFELFGPSHAREISGLVGISFLGRLPIESKIATMCDVGKVEEYPAEAFLPIAEKLIRTVGLKRRVDSETEDETS